MRTKSNIRLHELIPTTTNQDVLFEHAEECGKFMIVSSGAMWNSNGGSQRPQQIAEGFCVDHSVLHLNFVNSSHIVRKNLATGNKSNIASWIQNVPSGVKKIFYSAIPYEDDSAIIKRLGSDWTVVYDCVDDWGGFTSASEWYRPKYEEDIIKRADLITTTGRTMISRLLDVKGKKDDVNIRWLPNSCKLTPDMVHWKPERKIDLVFIGYLLDEWVDFKLMEKLSQKFSIRIIGEKPKVLPFKNERTEWIGKVPVEQIMDYLTECKVGLVPFVNTRLTYAVDPIKYYDYLAAGVPTVASFMPELDMRPFAHVCYSHESFIHKVEEILKNTIPHKRILRELEGNTYLDRVASLRGFIDEI